MDFRLRPNIDAVGWLFQNQYVRIQREQSSNQNLLLIPA
jgi:hypothetical protein